MSHEDSIDRFDEINRQLQDILDLKVQEGDPAEIEGKLLEELDEIEYEEGIKYFYYRDHPEENPDA